MPVGASTSEINSVITNGSGGDTIRFEADDYTGLTHEISDQRKNGITLAGGGRGAHLKHHAAAQKNAIFLKGVSVWETKASTSPVTAWTNRQ